MAASYSLPLRWLRWLWLAAIVVLLVSPSRALAATGDPTKGFTAVSLSESNFVLQKPYNLASADRYRFHNGVRQMWVLSSDKPHAPQSKTKPRTEIRMTGYDYSSGVWQFEGYGYVPSGTTGVSIMQVFGGGESAATTLMLHVYDGKLRYYSLQVVEDNIYDRWFRLNVIHDVEASSLTVFIDGVEKLRAPGRGGKHYFKFGVYTQHNSSSCMESRWKDVRILRKY